ncbi:hypothetical protein BRC99_06515 [Halobacteriales archaeon QS_7_69_60]|nr:MAG: hypothetical protein BRC99_06515 [Halobacteriales archaeon QS_7_69_60]
MRFRVPLLCALLAAALLAGAMPAGAQPPAEETRLEVQLQNDGDARWTIVATVPLENEGDVDSFRSFAEAFEGGEQDFRLGVDVFERAAEAATEATGREMSVGEPSRSAELIERSTDDGVDRYGELRVSFVWKSSAPTRRSSSGRRRATPLRRRRRSAPTTATSGGRGRRASSRATSRSSTSRRRTDRSSRRRRRCSSARWR